MIKCDVCKSDIDDPCCFDLGGLGLSGDRCGLREALIKEDVTKGTQMISEFLNEGNG